MSQGKILVVDDSEIALSAIRLGLEEADYSVSTVSSVFELNRAITKNPPDVILLDVRMPSLPGDQIVPILKRYSFSRHIAILLHSDMEPAELSRRAAESGASGFIAKTADSESLIRQIRPWIESVQARMPSA